MTRRERLIEWLLLMVVVVAGFALRARGIGHLLFWDEAMDIAGVRALVTNTRDWYSNVLWVHPPGFLVLMSWLNPLGAGFAERAELAAVLVQSLNLVLLYVLNRMVFGRWVAWLSCLALACLPGAVFFDVWIKRDHLVTTFGLLALCAGVTRRAGWAGLCLGLSLLSKETGVFFAPAVALMLWLRDDHTRDWRSVFAAGGVALVTCGWWYVLFSTTVQSILGFAAGTVDRLTEWSHPWYYYAQRLVPELGLAGCVLAAIGFLCPIVCQPGRRPFPFFAAQSSCVASSWAWLTLGIGYVVLSAARGKTPWMTLSFFPAWATMAGLGLATLIELCGRLPRHAALGRRVGYVAGAACGMWLLLTAMGRHHEGEQKRLGWGWWWGADASRQAAEALNRATTPDDRVLLSSFYYWGDDPVPTPCPIFAYYFRKDVPILVRSFRMTPDEAAATVREYQLTWALLSPDPARDGNAFLTAFITGNGLSAAVLPGAVLVNTKPMLKREGPRPSSP